jgi:hypothetical protein
MEELLTVFNNQVSELIEENHKSFKFYVRTATFLLILTIVIFIRPDIAGASVNLSILSMKKLPFDMFNLFFGSLIFFPVKEAIAKYNKVKNYEKVRKTLVLVSMQSEGNEKQVKDLIWKAIEKLTLE